MTKICQHCGVEFEVNPSRPNHHYHSDKCRNLARFKRWYARHRRHAIDRVKKWASENPEKRRRYDSKRSRENPERRARVLRWQKANPHKVNRNCRRWYQAKAASRNMVSLSVFANHSA